MVSLLSGTMYVEQRYQQLAATETVRDSKSEPKIKDEAVCQFQPSLLIQPNTTGRRCRSHRAEFCVLR